MNLLIKGLTIPKNIESFSIKINAFPDVTYYRTMFGASPLISGQCKIFIMPEKYGDLIDRDKLCKKQRNIKLPLQNNVVVYLDDVIEATAVIEAEQGG